MLAFKGGSEGRKGGRALLSWAKLQCVRLESRLVDAWCGDEAHNKAMAKNVGQE